MMSILMELPMQGQDWASDFGRKQRKDVDPRLAGLAKFFDNNKSNWKTEEFRPIHMQNSIFF